MTVLLLWTRLLPSGIKRLILHEDMKMATNNVIIIMIWNLLPDMQRRFAAKVRIIRLHDLGHSEIASANKDYITEMGIVDGGTVSMADGFIGHAT